MSSRSRSYRNRPTNRARVTSRFRDREIPTHEEPKNRTTSYEREEREREDRETCRDRIRRENQEYDRSIGRSRSISSPETTSRKGASRDNSKSNVRRSRSRERRGRHQSNRRSQENLRFEPPAGHRHEESFSRSSEHDPQLMFNSMQETAAEVMHISGFNRFSPPVQVEKFSAVVSNVEFEPRSGYSQDQSLGQINLQGPDGGYFMDPGAMHHSMYSQNQSYVPQQNLVLNQPHKESMLENITFHPKQSVMEANTNIQGFMTNKFPPDNSRLDFLTTVEKSEAIAEYGRGSDNGEAPLIPEYNPDTSHLTAYEWVKLIDENGKNHDWKTDEKQYIMASRLAGYARQWYLSTGINFKKWGELKQQFLNTFPSEIGFYHILQKMMGRSKVEDETMANYFHHKVALLNACDIHGKKAVSCITAGLQNPKLQQEVRLKNFDDPDELYLYLRTNSTQLPTLMTSYNKPTPVKETKPAKVTTGKACYKCHKVGHMSYHCPEKQTKTVGSLSIDNKVMHGSLSQKPTNPKHFIDVTVNGIILQGYIDPMSECTTMREETANLLKLTVRKQYKVVKGFYGSSFSSVGIVTAPLCVDRAIAEMSMYVIPDHLQAIPVIVGQSFSDQSHIVLLKDGDKIRFYQRMDNGKTNFDF